MPLIHIHLIITDERAVKAFSVKDQALKLNNENILAGEVG